MANLALVLNRLQSERPPSNQLPLILGRKLGELGETPIHPTPIDPPKPPPNPFGRMVAMDMAMVVEHGLNIVNCQSVRYQGDGVANAYQAKRHDGFLLTSCQNSRVSTFTPLANCQRVVFTDGFLLANNMAVKQDKIMPIFDQNILAVSETINFRMCLLAKTAKIKGLPHCQTLPLQPVLNYRHCSSHSSFGSLLSHCQSTHIEPVVPVPCRYYPIPEPPPKPLVGRCRVRPPSSRLPLTLTRKRGHLPSSALPLSLTCWHDNAPKVIANLRSYIVKNIVTATLGGVEIDVIDFEIKTDMASYCWQGSINMSDKQYQKIKHKLDVARGDEPLVVVTINHQSFAFMAETMSRNRAFAHYSYAISGRSITARLGQDYAQSRGGVIGQDYYASQIIHMQLADLPFSVDRFEVSDWLIPADTFNVSHQTPISIISQLATACGGKAISHPFEPKLSIIPRWKKAAWDVATATPDVVLPMDVVRSMSDQKRVNPRYNTVTLIGQTQGGEVYRERQGRDLIAPIDHHALYTDRDCFIQKGQQILSDSGIHADYQITMRWADKYNIPLAQLGQIWQVNDFEGAWKGVVTGVSVDVKLENDVPMVWQTVSIDRYLDV